MARRMGATKEVRAAKDNPKWLTFKQALEYLGVSRATLYRWTTAGKVSCRWVGPQLRYVPKELDAFLRKR